MIGNLHTRLAAHALAEGWILVTSNTREFERVSNLQVENWVESPAPPMTDNTSPPKKPADVTISRAKGRPMLSWVGKVQLRGPRGTLTLTLSRQRERGSNHDRTE